LRPCGGHGGGGVRADASVGLVLLEVDAGG
jgi:hypothetical protein